MQTAERGSEPWEAFPTLPIEMTESYFLHRQATSTHVEKNHTGTNNCNKIIAIIKVRVPAGKKKAICTSLHFLWEKAAAPQPCTSMT